MSHETEAGLNLRAVRSLVSELHAQGTLDSRVIDALKFGEGLVPQETELWDYKLAPGSDAAALGKTIRQIVSFYNSFGGYIVYGVSETQKDSVFEPIGITAKSLSTAQLVQLLRNYTGTAIDISYRDFSYPRFLNGLVMGVLHVPKRSTDIPPLFFGKNGPDAANGKPVFQKDQLYFRQLHECKPASSSADYVFLFGPRNNSQLWDASRPDTLVEASRVIENTLPDKNLICSHFVGRQDLLTSLWQWLADEFVHVKLLVGDGGKGKTSIAYEFARAVCLSGVYGFDKVIWLTAKSKRFVGALNDYVSMPDTDFEDTRTLLAALASELAVLPEEIEGASPSLLKKSIKTSLDQIRCLVVIDDVDSVDDEEQRSILNIAIQLASSGARFIVTTRMNFAIGREMAIQVGGLVGAEYTEYAASVAVSLGITPLKAKQVEAVRRITDGSPLFTESLLRLVRLGMNPDAAIHQWKGKLGSEARNAALDKEVQQLSPESRRVLYACSLMREASLAELKYATQYIDDRLHRCVEELQALFLVSAPTFIKGEPRFAVPDNTRLLVLENGPSIVGDPAALARRIESGRKKRSASTKNERVGPAINQAIALLREVRYEDALATIDAAVKELPRNHDLLSVRALILLAMAKEFKDPQALDSARRLFRECYDLGQRKFKTFELWYESEMLAKHWAGAVEVVNLALEGADEPAEEWFRRRVAANLELARSHAAGSGRSLALEALTAAATDVTTMLSTAGVTDRHALVEVLYQVHDEAWSVHLSVPADVPAVRLRLDDLRSWIEQGDRRAVNISRLVECTEELWSALPSRRMMSSAQRNLLMQAIRETESGLRRVLPNINKHDAHAQRTVAEASARFESIRSHLD